LFTSSPVYSEGDVFGTGSVVLSSLVLWFIPKDAFGTGSHKLHSVRFLSLVDFGKKQERL
jgi:hypothetical protein